MSETRDAFGPLLEKLQAEMRSVRIEQASLRALINARAEATEAFVGERFDLLYQRMDQTERSAEERLNRIEKLLTARPL